MLFIRGQATMTTDHGGPKIRPRTTTVLLVAGCGGVLFIATYIVLGFLTPGYNSLHDTISALELTPFKLAQQINFLVFGVLLCLFALGLRREMQQGFGSVLIPLIQFLDGLAVIGDAVFIRPVPHFRIGDQPPGTPKTGASRSWKRALACSRQLRSVFLLTAYKRRC
jgi:hypothetical protein